MIQHEPEGVGLSSARLRRLSASIRAGVDRSEIPGAVVALGRDADGGMTTSVGRIREDLSLDHGIKYLLMSHDRKMRAIKGAVLTAEYLVTTGYI